MLSASGPSSAFCLAFSALTPRSPWRPVGVGLVKRVPVDAMSRLSIASLQRVAPHEIFSHGDHLKVADFGAQPVAAQVVERHPLGDGSDQASPSDAMDVSVLCIPAHDSIATIPTALPDAAPVCVDDRICQQAIPDPIGDLGKLNVGDHMKVYMTGTLQKHKKGK